MPRGCILRSFRVGGAGDARYRGISLPEQSRAMSTLNLLIFLFPLAYSPGPGNLFFAALGARAGWRAAWPAFAGYHAATFLAAVATGAGLLALAGPLAMGWLRYAGAAYMLWLARALWRAGAPQAAMAPRARATDGAALLALNPKA
ncbi:LysE family translocator [Roseibaca sp. Y0-43]|uniref:LysE family translocator n=1 Tax=Roseibaca sp. Y0-43 TaxID=2816854 RepID=UPI001D0C18E0|nr:LysE family transporter [Roseibaca sp. Y0-43]MCC1482543.1 LysE family transporter [Roseibaca sp. Y0-43]